MAENNSTPPQNLAKQVRATLKLTRKELSNLLGVSHRTIEGWENGRPLSKLALKALEGLLK